MTIKALPILEFVLAASPDRLRIVFSDELLWEARSGDVTLAKPDGVVGFGNLPGLLSVLAGVGIRACIIEWDGLPAFPPKDLI